MTTHFSKQIEHKIQYMCERHSGTREKIETLIEAKLEEILNTMGIPEPPSKKGSK